MNERLKALRKHLDLTMESFGSRIGLTKSMISRMESGALVPTDRTVLSICQTFGVNEQWLRTGEGEMFLEDDKSILARMLLQYDISPKEQAILSAYLKLSAEDRAAILRYLDNLVQELTRPAAGQ